MDELTRERHPYGIPWRELVRNPQQHIPEDVLRQRRVALCGTVNVDDVVPIAEVRRLAKERRLLDAIRRWVA